MTMHASLLVDVKMSINIYLHQFHKANVPEGGYNTSTTMSLKHEYKGVIMLREFTMQNSHRDTWIFNPQEIPLEAIDDGLMSQVT